MIHVTRLPKPPILVDNETQWLDELHKAIAHRDGLLNNPQAQGQKLTSAEDKVKTVQKRYNRREIKDALVNMFHGKCAYCESPIGVVAYGHIEHFCPKSLCVDKTFSWENLLLACDRCNVGKGTKFPVDVMDNPLLIDPTDSRVDPNNHLKFSWDEKAKLASIYGLDDKGRKTVEIFDLNGTGGRIDLIKARSRQVRNLLALLILTRQNNQEALDLLHEACQPDAPYSAFAHAYITEVISQINIGA